MDYVVKPMKPFGVIVEPSYERASITDIAIEDLRDLFLEHQLVILRQFKSLGDADSFATYCERWGTISLWPFGKVLELVQQEEPQDHIFDNSYVPLHWDGMYRPTVPEYQIFQCVKAPLPDQGGRTVFSNTRLVLEKANIADRKRWTKVVGTYQRQMEFYHSRTISPLVTKHPHRQYTVIRYNEPHHEERGSFVNPPDLEFQGLPTDELDGLHQSLRETLYHEDYVYAHQWQDGDIVIADNFTLLHGREAFISKSPRHLRRVQVDSHPPFRNPGLESYQ